MKNSLAKSAVFNIIYQVLNVFFPLISATYVAKVLSPSGVGEVAYTQNIVSYFVLIAVLGMPTYGTREIAKCQDKRQLNILFSELFFINAIATGICLAVYSAFVFFVADGNHLLYVICGLELLFNFINVDWFYRGKEDFVYIAVRSAAVKLVSLLLLFLFVRDKSDCAVYALLVCLANGCNYFFNIVRLRRDVELTIRGLNLNKHMNSLISLLICSIAASLYSKVDITMLGNISSSTSVGLYSTAFKTIGIAIAVVASATGVFLPRISYCYQTDREKFCEYVTTGLKVVAFLAVPASVGIAMVSPDLMIVLFGTEYTVAASVVAILAPLLVIKGVGDILCYQVLVSAGKEKLFLVSYMIAAVANIVLNFLLIPHLDYNGAAIASVTSELIVNITLLRYSRQVVKPKLGAGYLTSLLCGTIVMAVLVLFVQTIASTPVFRLFGAVSLGCIAYFAVNLILKNDIIQMVLSRLKSRRG